LTAKGLKKIWKSLKIEPVNEKLRSYRSHWATKCNKNEQQDAKKEKNKCGILDEMDEDGLEDL